MTLPTSVDITIDADLAPFDIPEVTRPRVVNFAPTETALINAALDWITTNVRPLLPRRQITIGPMDDAKNSGHISLWTGDMTLDRASVNAAHTPELVATIGHELMHAKSDLLGRLKQSYDIARGHSEEHDFLQEADLAIKNMFAGPLGSAQRGLVFAENGEPLLSYSDGSGQRGLPEWSAIRRAFQEDLVWKTMAAQ